MAHHIILRVEDDDRPIEVDFYVSKYTPAEAEANQLAMLEAMHAGLRMRGYNARLFRREEKDTLLR